MATSNDNVWRIGSRGEAERPVTVLEVNGELYDLDALPGSRPDGPNDVLSILNGWDAWRDALEDAATRTDGTEPLAEAQVAWLPPVSLMSSSLVGFRT